jgi:uncharacterized YigZ family protein
MRETFRQLATPGDVELVVRRSRFLGFAQPCESAEDARRILAALRSEHPKAAHHVFAWRVRDDDSGQLSHRFDDDGEPGGTAGRPLLQVLESQQVVNAEIVVVRYFGGIKLGAGGLVRAYSEAASKALAAGQLRVLIPMQSLLVRVPFQWLPAIERLASQEGFEIRSRRFGSDAALTLEVQADRADELSGRIADLTRGAAQIE